jgi:prepilin-type N-terminal cleavage/methylation domain-containing protein
VSVEATEMKKRKHASRGFSLVELLVGTILFTIVTGIAFSLLMSAQLRYQGESTVTEAFQQANVALDQIVRDVHSAGYPPISSLSATVANNPANASQYALPFAWVPKYPATPCTVGVGGTCTIPGEYDLILEADTLFAAGHHSDARRGGKGRYGSRGFNQPATVGVVPRERHERQQLASDFFLHL